MMYNLNQVPFTALQDNFARKDADCQSQNRTNQTPSVHSTTNPLTFHKINQLLDLHEQRSLTRAKLSATAQTIDRLKRDLDILVIQYEELTYLVDDYGDQEALNQIAQLGEQIKTVTRKADKYNHCLVGQLNQITQLDTLRLEVVKGVC